MRSDLQRALVANGLAWDFIQDVEAQPKLKYYSLDKVSGKVIEHCLPADNYSLSLYLRKGFKLNPSELERPQPILAVAPPKTHTKHRRK